MNPKVGPNRKETIVDPHSGGCCCLLAFIFLIVGLAGGIVLSILVTPWCAFIPPIGLLVFLCLICGVFSVNPNEARILTFWGKYKGTVKTNGLFFVNPFYTKENCSLAANNLQTNKIKVNDKMGNPVEIAVSLVWQIDDTYRARFDVENFDTYVNL